MACSRAVSDTPSFYPTNMPIQNAIIFTSLEHIPKPTCRLHVLQFCVDLLVHEFPLLACQDCAEILLDK